MTVVSIQKVNGKDVTFFASPKHFKDMPWCNVRELAGAFAGRKEGRRFLSLYQMHKNRPEPRVLAHGSKMVDVTPHMFAQSIAARYDTKLNGVPQDADGPFFKDYCKAAVRAFEVLYPEYNIWDCAEAAKNQSYYAENV